MHGYAVTSHFTHSRIIQYGLWNQLPKDGSSGDYNDTLARNKWRKISLGDEIFEFMEENEDGALYPDWRSTPTRAIEFKE